MEAANSYQQNSGRLLYIENIRILLSSLVIIVHVSCTYGGPGGWSYIEKGADILTIFTLTVINATSQSFFMGLFFFIGAYFTHKSFLKKGFLNFIKDRIIRLGVPLAITFWFISPLTSYFSWSVKYETFANASFLDIWKTGNAFGVGVMWFVEALSYFTVLYLIAYYLLPSLRKTQKKKLPPIKWWHILGLSLVTGLATFLTRIEYPLFQNHHSLHFDLGHFPQYIVLFVLGIKAAQYENDQFITFEQSKKWFWFVLVLMLAVFPLLFFLGNANTQGIQPFIGGFTWRSLAYSIWEQVIGFSIMVALLGFLKAKWNHQNKIFSKLAGSSYAVYVIHPPVLVGISVFLRNWEVMHLLKFSALVPLAIFASFGLGLLIKQIPLLNKIF